MRQLQVILEKRCFPWIVTDALNELVAEGNLLRIYTKTPKERNVIFFMHAKFANATDLPKIQRRITSICRLIDLYSAETVTNHLGEHLENLLHQELRAQGFRIVGRHTNKYNGMEWTQSEHNLDFIAEHNPATLTWVSR